MCRTSFWRFVANTYEDEGPFMFVCIVVFTLTVILVTLPGYIVPWLISKIPGCEWVWSDIGWGMTWIAILFLLFFVSLAEVFL